MPAEIDTRVLLLEGLEPRVRTVSPEREVVLRIEVGIFQSGFKSVVLSVTGWHEGTGLNFRDLQPIQEFLWFAIVHQEGKDDLAKITSVVGFVKDPFRS
jgi:hypothetical protein